MFQTPSQNCEKRLLDFVMSVCPFVRPSVRPAVCIELCSHWMGFHLMWYLSFFKIPLRKSKFHQNLIRITGILHEDVCTFMKVSWSVLLRMRNVSDKSLREYQNTHFTFNTLFRKSCPLWDNVKEYGRTRQVTANTTQLMRFACRITKATNKNSKCIIIIAVPR
jgi:hypothetical protein